MRVFCSIFLIIAAASGFAQNAFIRTYGQEGAFNEGKGIVAFPDSSYILLGNRQTFGGQSAAWLFRVDSSGTILWEKYFDSYMISSAENLSRHDDTSVVITGTALSGNDYSMLVARIGLSGSVLWEKIYGTNVWDQGLCAASDSYGNVYLTGYGQALDTMDQDILLYKLDGNSGDSILFKRLDDGFNDKCVFIDTIATNDLILASQSFNDSGELVYSKIWRMNNVLDTIWTMIPGLGNASIRTVECVMQDIYKRVIFSGEILPDTGSVSRFWYGCVSGSGVFQWEVIQPPYFLRNIRRSVVDTNGVLYFTGGIHDILYGFGNSDIGLWIDNNGILGFYYYGGLQDEEGMDLDLAADGGLALIGTTKNYGPGVNNIFFVKVGPDHNYNGSDHAHYTPVSSPEASDVKLSPNPSSGSFRIDLPDNYECRMDIYNLQGMQVASDRYYSGETYTLSGCSNGVYLIKITSEAQSYNFRLILQQD